MHRFNGDGTASARAANASADAEQEKPVEPEGVKLLLQQFSELREYASYYAVTQIDSAKAAAGKAIERIVISALGLGAIAGLIVMASWFVLSGMAQGLSTLFGDRPWIGPLLTGMAALVCAGVMVQRVGAVRRENARKETDEKYEARHDEQRKRFGRDARDRGSTPADPRE